MSAGESIFRRLVIQIMRTSQFCLSTTHPYSCPMGSFVIAPTVRKSVRTPKVVEYKSILLLTFQWIANMFTTLNGGSSVRIRGNRGRAVEKELDRIVRSKRILDDIKAHSHTRVAPIYKNQARISPIIVWQMEDYGRPHYSPTPTPSTYSSSRTPCTYSSSSNGVAMPRDERDDDMWTGWTRYALIIGLVLFLLVTFHLL
jgi:hypothetical protein